MQEKNSYRPEELLYRMGHSTRAMNAFFSMDEEAREAALGRIAAEPDAAQAEADALAPRKVPQQRRRQSNTDDHRHKHGADAVRQPGDGRLGGGGLLHEPDDLGEGGIFSYPCGLAA